MKNTGLLAGASPTSELIKFRKPEPSAENGIEIVAGRPPNFDKIVRVFPAAARMGVIFTYGHVIYVSGGKELVRSLVAHEVCHVKQQEVMGRDEWWDRYLVDPQFRFGQELEAHIHEYAVRCEGAGRNERRQALHQIAQKLAGPLYGNVTTLKKAKELLKL